MNARKRILVADDSLPTCAMLKTELANLGYEVDLANNGAEAVKATLTNQYDLILMDVYMPLMTGLEATRQIVERQRNAGKPATPIIAITAGASREQCFEAGMTGYLEKPILGHTLRRYLAEFSNMNHLNGASNKVEVELVKKIDLGEIIKNRRTSGSLKKNA